MYFLQINSTQNYLECVGRLQDHCDTLEDIRSDLQANSPLAEDIEGLHCQLEEVQVCHLLSLFTSLKFSDPQTPDTPAFY